ncbi:MAG: hypothetical protein AABW51_04260 [Nanoarchaeota archaeon]
MGKKDGNGTVVKIDSELFKKVENLIKKDENRLKFTNKKQFIDLAVNDFLKKMEEKDGKK